MIRIVFLADVVGSCGRRMVKEQIPTLRTSFSPDLIIVNAENAAGGVGTDPATADELLRAGADLLSGGNHTFNRREFHPYLDHPNSKALRPYNFPEGAPGKGVMVVEVKGVKVGLLNLQARLYMGDLIDSPFTAADRALEKELAESKVIFVDFHGEATSEKIALANYLDGRVSAVVGTHTHVQTADERILSGGTATLTDVGMCGAYESTLGMKTKQSIEKFMTGLPLRYESEKGRGMVNGVVVDIDELTGKAERIERIRIVESA